MPTAVPSSNTSESHQATLLRVAIIEHISDIDLPPFLLAHIEYTFSYLNVYKLGNLMRNITEYTTYLDELVEQYMRHVRALSHRWSSTNSSFSVGLNSTLAAEWFTFGCTWTEFFTATSMFTVSCTLTTKEFIHKRIMQRSLLTKQSMSVSS